MAMALRAGSTAVAEGRAAEALLEVALRTNGQPVRKRVGMGLDVKTVGFDLDGVVADSIRLLLRDLQDRMGFNIDYSDLREYPLHHNLPVENPHEHSSRLDGIFDEIWISRSREIGLIDERIPEMIRNFMEHCQVHITTGAAKGSVLAFAPIVSMLSRHGIRYHDIHHVGSHVEKSKLQMIDIFVEDDPRFAVLMEEARRPMLLLAQPWNAALRESIKLRGGSEYITPVDDWSEVERELMKLLKPK